MQANAASMLLDPREYWQGLDHQSRVLLVSVTASILLIIKQVFFKKQDAKI